MQLIKKKERINIHIDDIVYGGNGISKQEYENSIIFAAISVNA